MVNRNGMWYCKGSRVKKVGPNLYQILARKTKNKKKDVRLLNFRSSQVPGPGMTPVCYGYGSCITSAPGQLAQAGDTSFSVYEEEGLWPHCINIESSLWGQPFKAQTYLNIGIPNPE